MPNPMNPMEREFVVVAASAAGERFAIFKSAAINWTAVFHSILDDGWREVEKQWQESTAWLIEDDVRKQLTQLGVSKDEVDEHIRQARRFARQMGEVIIERPSRIGYRNADRQEVLRKTDLAGSIPGQRVYVMRCGDCGYEYGANGCDISSHRCPSCQGGFPGLPVSNILE